MSTSTRSWPRSNAKFEVVEPKLKMTLAGPDKRFTDTVASYAITLENPGTAPAKNLKVMATLGVSGRLVAVPPGAKYDSASRRLQWTIPQIDPNEKGKTLPFEVRMGGISAYEINVEARGDNALNVKDRRITDVQGMADVDLVVRERRRVVDVDGTTTFQIRLRNYGTKEATKLQVSAKLSDNLVVDSTAGGPEGDAYAKDGEVKFPIIERLGPGQGDDAGHQGEGHQAPAQDRDVPDLPAPRRPDGAARGHGRRQGHRVPPRGQHQSVTRGCPRIPDGKFRMANSGWQIPDDGFRMANSGWRIPDGKFRMANSGWPIPGFQISPVSHLTSDAWHPSSVICHFVICHLASGI